MADDEKSFLDAPESDKKFSMAGGIFTGIGAHLLGASLVLSTISGLGGMATVFYAIKQMNKKVPPSA
jgi:hypothetical protein